MNSSENEKSAHAGPWSLARLRKEAATDGRRWIIEPLIAEGDQVILAGEPKSGKSLLASQLCLEIARSAGTEELLISTPKEVGGAVDEGTEKRRSAFTVGRIPVDRPRARWSLLFVSFEMGPETVWSRIRDQARDLRMQILTPMKAAGPIEANTVLDEGENLMDFHHIFELANERTLGLFSQESRSAGRKSTQQTRANCKKEWEETIRAIQPDLIIFDSLSQMHSCDENSNPEMKEVLQTLRTLCTLEVAANGNKPAQKRRIAHIAIHHLRKESGENGFFRKGASEMRGASAIHAEADLAITITKRESNGSEISLGFSSRHIDTPADLRLERRERELIYRGVKAPTSTKVLVAQRLFALLSNRTEALLLDEIREIYDQEHANDDDLGKETLKKVVNQLAKRSLVSKTFGKKNNPTKVSLTPATTAAEWAKRIKGLR